MNRNNHHSVQKETEEKWDQVAFFLKLVMGIIGVMYLFLLTYSFLFNIRYPTSGSVVIYYEIILFVYFLLLLKVIHDGGVNFKLRYAYLSVADLVAAIFLFGFNASASYPISSPDPWNWGITNVFSFLQVYQVSSFFVFMLVGTIFLIFLRIRAFRKGISVG